MSGVGQGASGRPVRGSAAAARPHSAAAWPALAAARRHDPGLRVPFVIDGVRVGSVARAHLEALAEWPQALAVGGQGVTLKPGAADRDAALAAINAGLRRLGLVQGWRDEVFAIVDPASGTRLAATERAASRFWGTLTRGAHANGYVADAQGRPTHLWIARRSATKATDPGLFDNLVGGGVPAGQTPLQALVREGWEEAGLSPSQMQAARPGRVLRLLRDIPQGLQFEDLYGHDLALPPDARPENQDGEVAGFQRLTVEQALALAAGDSMTVDAALVTLDFALRHALLPTSHARALSTALFACAVAGDQTS